MLPNQQILCPSCRQPDYPGTVFCANCGHDMVLNDNGPRYYITRVIKAGGQGAVYEAVGEDGTVYAIKEMLENFADAKERSAGVARFEAEANLLQRLKHPRIPRVYTHFADEGRYYLAMDFVRGQDLADLVDSRGPIPEPEVLVWAEQIGEVLTYLHDQGLIYRDMKPSNVMLEPDGRIKVVDFGIAKVLQPSRQGTQVGTPGYAPPEQYQGLAGTESDVFALAATLHHLLTARDPTQHPPFSFPPAQKLVPAISTRVSDALQKALQMNIEDRFPSVAAFLAALRPAPAAVSAAVAKAAPATSGAATVAGGPASVAAGTAGASIPSPATANPVPASVPAPNASNMATGASVPASVSAGVPAAAGAGTPGAAGVPGSAAANRPGAASAAGGAAVAAAPPSQVLARPADPATGPQPAAAAGSAPLPTPPWAGQPTTQPAPRRGIGCMLATIMLVVLLAAGAYLYLSGSLSALNLPGLQAGPTATPQTFVAQELRYDNLEYLVPSGTNIDPSAAASQTFEQLARQQLGPLARLEPGSLEFIGGPPQQVRDEPQGVVYRVSLKGTVLTPQP